MVKVVVLSPEDISVRNDLVGTWIDERHYKVLVEEDMDLYLPPTGFGEGNDLNEHNIVFKFRKNFFSTEEVASAYDGLREAATETQNRGKAAGPRGEKCGNREWVTNFQYDILNAFKGKRINLDGDDIIDLIVEKYKNVQSVEVAETRGQVWLTDSVKKHNIQFDDWVQKTKLLSEDEGAKQSKWLEKTFISNTTYANVVFSGIAGWYDRYPRIPFGRATGYTRDNPEQFEKAYPYLQSLARGFKELLPWRYNNQMVAAAKVDPKFVIPETPFTTVTVNRNFRCAAHYDPANMENGFANICVVSKNDNYSGSYLVFPELGYAVNIRPSDLLFVNNQAGLHGNTELVLHDDTAERVSMIAFFHEGMLELGTFDYENTRREFVDSRRLNKDHPEQRNRWNGISPGMWADSKEKSNNYDNAKEWYGYLKGIKQGDTWLDNYHPWLKEYFEDSSGLEAFF
tara:strand:- start:1561 stop:2928 length:1368 start_codon:yes stop_codon:yes gene_type:complete